VRSAFEALGPISPDIAADLGLTDDVPVYCGIHDSNASLLPHLIKNEPPFSVVSTGTWVICFGVGGELAHLDPGRDTLANVDAYGRAVPSSRFMGGREFETVAADLGAFDQAAAETALDATVEKGMMLLPNIADGTGPFPGKVSRWIGADGASTAERYAALALYLALMTEACLQLIGARGAIFVEGPFAHNRLYSAALSALTARDVIALPGSTGTSQGAALLTGVAAFEKHAPGSTQTPPLSDLRAYRKAWYAAMDERIPVA
jgi:sugar (pentulose or hexulose) kinase